MAKITNGKPEKLKRTMNAQAGHIIAIGGGGFSSDERITSIEKYALSLISSKRPTVCFVPTASGDSAAYIERFYRAFAEVECKRNHITLFKNTGNAKKALLSSDLVYIGGGNTANLLALWRLHQVDAYILKAYKRGAVLVGISAGAMALFDGGLTDSYGSELRILHDGLGIIPGLFCPHFSSDSSRTISFKQAVLEQDCVGFAIDDNAALHFRGTQLVTFISSSIASDAYRITVSEGSVLETRLRSSL